MGTPDGDSTAGFSTASELTQPAARDRPALVPTLTVLSHPDLGRIGERVFLGELVAGGEVLLSREKPRFSAPGAAQGRPLGDRFLSRRPLRFELLPAGDVRLHVDGSRTRIAIDGVPVDAVATLAAGALDDGIVLELARRIVLLFHHHRPVNGGEGGERFGLVGASTEIEEVRTAIERGAGVGKPVLIRGDTGTGKELVARALHQISPRRQGPFVSVNLGELVPSLATAELFGARKGAYTGAAQGQAGYFGRAHGGTLFLDEIGAAPPEVQVMLLRAIETGEIVRVGSQTPQRIDVRILSATDADLDHRIGAFSSPLLHRLAGYTLWVPPLRRRRDDIGRLLVHFLRRELAATGTSLGEYDPEVREPWLPAALVVRLARYDWPGNVRQLHNVVRQLVIDSSGRPTLELSAQIEALLYPRPQPGPTPAGPAEATPSARRRKPAEVSEEELTAALRRRRFNLKETAAALGVSRTSLYGLIERSPGLRSPADVPAAEIRAAWERHGGDLEPMVEALEISERALRQRLKDLGLSRAGT